MREIQKRGRKLGQAQENRRRNVPHGKAEIMIFCGTMTAAVRSALNIMWNMKTHGNGCFAMFQNIKIKYEKYLGGVCMPPIVLR